MSSVWWADERSTGSLAGEVLSYLTLHDVIACSQCNKDWHARWTQPWVWYSLFRTICLENHTDKVDLMDKGLFTRDEFQWNSEMTLANNSHVIASNERSSDRKTDTLSSSSSSLDSRVVSVPALLRDHVYMPLECTVNWYEECKLMYIAAHKKLVCEKKDHTDEILFCCFSHSGEYMCTASRDCTAKVWTVDSNGETSLKWTLELANTVTHCVFSENDKYVLIRTNNRLARDMSSLEHVVNVLTGSLIHRSSTAPDFMSRWIPSELIGGADAFVVTMGTRGYDANTSSWRMAEWDLETGVAVQPFLLVVFLVLDSGVFESNFYFPLRTSVHWRFCLHMIRFASVNGQLLLVSPTGDQHHRVEVLVYDTEVLRAGLDELREAVENAAEARRVTVSVRSLSNDTKKDTGLPVIWESPPQSPSLTWAMHQNGDTLEPLNLSSNDESSEKRIVGPETLLKEKGSQALERLNMFTMTVDGSINGLDVCDGVLALSFRPNLDGRVMPMIGIQLKRHEGQLNVYSLPEGKLLSTHQGPVCVTCTWENKDTLPFFQWPHASPLAQPMDVDTKECSCALHRKGVPQPSHPLRGIMMAMGDEKGTVHIYNAAYQTRLTKWHAHEDVVNTVAWCPGKTGLLASCSDDHILRLWR